MAEARRVWPALAALLAAVLLMGGLWWFTRPGAVEGRKSITVEVVHRDGQSRSFSYRTDHTHLGPLLLEEGLVEGEDGPFGLYIHVVDGQRAVYEEDGAYWALYEGEEYASTGADTLPIADGDHFRLVYTLG
jgi:hypothetical protein